MEALLVLRPGVVHCREIGPEGLARGLRDGGKYVLRLNPKGCWWCFGEVGESESGDGGRVPRSVYGVNFKVQVALRSDDEVEFGLEDGRRVVGL